MTAATTARPNQDTDFHAWALDQARRLRAYARTRPNEPLDWELLAEEIEDMGKRDRRTCESFLERIIEHLLRIDYARDPQTLRHWAAEVRIFRRHLARVITPTIRVLLRRNLRRHYLAAVEDAELSMRADPTFLDRAPRECPYSWDQITGDWLPERAGGE
jgi:hypothetical protein